MRFFFDRFELDDDGGQLWEDGTQVHLGRGSLRLLQYLVGNRGRAISQEELRATVWDGKEVRASTIPTAVAELRKILRDPSSDPRIIQTLYGRGYKFIADVRAVQARRSGSRRPEFDLAADFRPFVGRTSELAALDAVVERSTVKGQLALIVGEPGIGKTRLLERFAGVCEEKGCSIFLLRCTEAGGAVPFAPWKELIETYRSLPGASLTSLADVDASSLEMLTKADPRLSFNADESEGLPAESGRYRLFAALQQAIASMGAQDRSVVLLDDLHRADRGSIRVIQYLCEAGIPTSVSVIGALRCWEENFPEPLGAVVSRVSRWDFGRLIDLAGLDEPCVRELAAHVQSKPIDDSVVETVLAQTGGNPLFATRLLEGWSAGEIRLGSDGIQSLPKHLQAAIRDHLSGLSVDCRDALRAAAVLGRDFSASRLAVLLNRSYESCTKLLDDARSFGVLLGEDPYRFTHVLLRDSLYEGLTPSEREHAHASAAEAAAPDGPQGIESAVLSEAAHHALLAGSALDPGRRIRILCAAGQMAHRRFAYEEAARYFAGALDGFTHQSRELQLLRCDLLIWLADSLHRSNDRAGGEDCARRAIELAKACDDGERMSRAALQYAPSFFAIEVGVVDEYLVKSLEDAASRLDHGSSSLKARVLARLAMALCWTSDRERRRKLGSWSVELAQEAGEKSCLAFALTASEIANWDPANARTREAVAKQAIQWALDSNSHEMELVYRVYRLTALLQLGRAAAALEEIEAFGARATESLSPQALWFVDLFRAMLAMVRGQWEEAEAQTTAFVERGKAVGDRNAEHSRVVHEVYRGMECGPISDSVERAKEQWNSHRRVGSYRCSLPNLYLLSGDRRSAALVFREIAREGFSSIPRNVEWFVGMGMLAEACCVVGNSARAEELYSILSPHRSECAVVGFGVAVFRPVAYFLGRLATRLGRFRQASDDFSVAMGLADRFGATPWIVHIEKGLGELHLRRGKPGDMVAARELLMRSRRGAGELSMLPVQREIDSLLQYVRPSVA